MIKRFFLLVFITLSFIDCIATNVETFPILCIGADVKTFPIECGDTVYARIDGKIMAMKLVKIEYNIGDSKSIFHFYCADEKIRQIKIRRFVDKYEYELEYSLSSESVKKYKDEELSMKYGVDVYIFNGKYVFHERYGYQFQVSSYERIEPEGKDAVIEFLTSSFVSGCGEKTAKKIVEVFINKGLVSITCLLV